MTLLRKNAFRSMLWAITWLLVIIGLWMWLVVLPGVGLVALFLGVRA